MVMWVYMLHRWARCGVVVTVCLCCSWLLEAFKEVLAWAKGGQWPYSQQQTVLGARYAFTSLLLVAAALFLLVTLSSGDTRVPQPRHPGWTTVCHILHPFVAMRYLEPPPTWHPNLTCGTPWGWSEEGAATSIPAMNDLVVLHRAETFITFFPDGVKSLFKSLHMSVVSHL